MRTTLRTERLLLRPLDLADAPRVAELTSEPDVARMVAMIPLPHPQVCVEGWILIMQARAPLGLDHVYAIELAGAGRAGERLIGCIGAHVRQAGGVEFGYWLGRRFWGRGLATEAARAAAAEARALGALTASHFLDNPASGRVLEKAGFSYTGAIELRFSLARREKTPARIMTVPGLPQAA
jgi:RimJ/RimL family protein N-acetyltransferase